MSTLFEIGEWIKEHEPLIVQEWLAEGTVVNIFSKHKVSLKKFSENFAKGIIEHTVDVIQSKKEMNNCPIMNKFVDLMLKKHIKSEEILIICVTLRTTVLTHLVANNIQLIQDASTLKAILKIFDVNLSGVLANFDRASMEINLDKQKESQLKKYLSRLQTILDAQDNIIFKLRDYQLYIANKALYITTGVKDMTAFKKKYPMPLNFIKDVDFHSTLFKNRHYDKWINQIVEHHRGECKIKIFDHITNQSSLMKMKITKIGEFNDFVFTLENITAQQNKINSLSNLAYKDSLTNMNNLKGFELLLEEKLHKSENKNLKILILELKGFTLYSEQHPRAESEKLIADIAESIKEYYPRESARIDKNRFAILSNELTLENSHQFIQDLEKTVALSTHPDSIKINAAIILLHEKETADSLIERGELLLHHTKNAPDELIIDEHIMNRQEQERLQQQKLFLSKIKEYQQDNKNIDVTNYYLEIPLKSSAKIIAVTQKEIRVHVRKISVISLNYGDILYIEMENEQDFKASVKSIDIEKDELVLEYFKQVKTSPLNRQSLHVKLKHPLEIVLKSEKVQIIEELDTVSIKTFVVFVNHLYDIKEGSELKMSVAFNKQEEQFIGNVVKLLPVANKFKLIIHLQQTPSIERALISFVSTRQMEIIKELQEKASFISKK